MTIPGNLPLVDVLLTRFAVPAGIAVLVLVGFWIGAALVQRLITKLGAARKLDEDLTSFVARIGRIAFLTFGGVTALGTLGVDINGLVAGLGLTGFALGFALKDIISNSLAGVLVLIYKPFRRGDHIEIAGSSGTVTEIDLRYTVLLGDGGARVLVPNATLFTSSIRVVSPPSPSPPT